MVNSYTFELTTFWGLPATAIRSEGELTNNIVDWNLMQWEVLPAVPGQKGHEWTALGFKNSDITHQIYTAPLVGD